ncbi:hypothetical protein AB0K25_21480 [Micromonospora sp. NPDC049257]|uniref:hypothetical protein n=1 Tax=Micromonospora sp. NPDC049257 TaxID=3155771 RepID=UPI00344A28A3
MWWKTAAVPTVALPAASLGRTAHRRVPPGPAMGHGGPGSPEPVVGRVPHRPASAASDEHLRAAVIRAGTV